MTSIKLMLTGAQAWASVNGPLTSGMVGLPVTIEYDAAWNGLTKNLMCRCSPWGSYDGEIRTILNVEEASVVAHEVMQAGLYLYLGVEGFSSDGKLVIPTTWAGCGKIEYGANTADDPTTEPELPIWNQLQIEMEKTKEYVLTPEQATNIQAYAREATQSAQEAKQAAEEAKQAAESHLYYIPVLTQPTDTTLKFEFKPSVTGAPIPKPVTVELPVSESAEPNVSVFAGKTASFYGDSITEQNAHYTKGYHAWVKELLGLASYNNYGTSSYKVSNVYSKVNEISDSADIVFVMCGVNDQTFSVPLGAMGDTTTGTTYGSLHLLCNALKTKYPTSIIVFITPAYQTKYPHNSGVTSYEVSKAIREVCQKFAIPVYDNFVLSGIYDTNLSVFTTDNCHWNDTGHEMVGKNLAAYMLDTFHYVHGYTGDGAGGGETPDETDKTLTGISATYSGGSVPVGTAVTALTGVVVTAQYSDGSTATVTGYTLSGSSAEGENTVTVTYGGMTATFTVTGVAESDSTRIYAKDYDEEEGIWTQYGNIRTDLEGYTHTDYIPIGANVPFEIYTNLQAYMAFFDAEKKFISITLDGPPSQFTSVNGTTPANCAYFAFNMRSPSRDQYYIEY